MMNIEKLIAYCSNPDSLKDYEVTKELLVQFDEWVGTLSDVERESIDLMKFVTEKALTTEMMVGLLTFLVKEGISKWYFFDSVDNVVISNEEARHRKVDESWLIFLVC